MEVVPQAEGKDFSNVGGSFDCVDVQCNIKIAPQQVAEKFEITLGSLIIQPTFANEEREIKFVVGNATGNIPFFNITISQINENQIVFDMIPVGIAESIEIEIEGSKLFEIHVNGINHTFTFTAQGAGNSKIVIDDIETTPNNVTAFFTQNANIQFATFGRSLEGDFVNNFTKIEFDRVQGIAEHYLSVENVRKIIDFTVNDGQKAYEIAGKMIIPIGFTPEANLTQAGQAYIDGIQNSTSFAEIFDKIEQRMRNETLTDDTGNVPNAGKEPEDS